MLGLPREILGNAFELILPHFCVVCGRRTYGVAVCRTCRPRIPNIASAFRCEQCFTFAKILSDGTRCSLCRLFPTPFRRMRYLWDYSQDDLRELITIMKYRPSLAACKYLIGVLVQRIPELFPDMNWDMVVPVPLSKQSLHQRGFNQCAYLAREIAKHQSTGKCNRASLNTLLHKGYKSVQASLPMSKRSANVRNAFRCKGKISEKTVLLVDDVITTGATVLAATRSLLDCGAAHVDVVALARSAIWQESRSMHTT